MKIQRTEWLSEYLHLYSKPILPRIVKFVPFNDKLFFKYSEKLDAYEELRLVMLLDALNTRAFVRTMYGWDKKPFREVSIFDLIGIK